ncbi:MAG TPA: hypothetical protein VF320_05970, partial [Acidimicrobiales bacterium]
PATRAPDRPTGTRRRRGLGASLTLAAAVVAVASILAGCGSSKSSGTTATSACADLSGRSCTTPSTSTAASPASDSTTNPHALDTLPAGTATIDQATVAQGAVLVDGKGYTLYAFTADAGGASPCVDACAEAWPPLTGTGLGVADGVPVTPGKFTLVTRPDGTKQAAVNGHPLYRYSGDTQPGQANGQGLGGQWYVVGLDGNPITS